MKFVPDQAPSPAGAPPGRVLVTNGTESHWIEPADVAEAAKDGFRPAGGAQ